MSSEATLSARGILSFGISKGNVGVVQLLGLCPLLAVSNNAVNALGLGLASLLALILTNTLVASLRSLIGRDIRIPAFVMIIAAVVTGTELAIRAFFPQLYEVLGIFIPLIVTNCAIMGRAEACASRNHPGFAALDGFSAGLGFLWVLLAIGALRELLSQGTVFAGSSELLGLPALTFTVLSDYRGFLLASLPVGAFLALAIIIAVRQKLLTWANARRSSQSV